MNNDSSISRGQNIFLIGSMGSGKSTIGKALAHRIEYTFCDMDVLIEDAVGLDIVTIFYEQGEESFRRYETEMLRGLIQQDHVVIATGGGAVLTSINRQLMTQSGMIIYLESNLQTRLQRIGDGSSRPLIANQSPSQQMKIINDLDEQRISIYEELATFKVYNEDSEANVLNMIENKIQEICS